MTYVTYRPISIEIRMTREEAWQLRESIVDDEAPLAKALDDAIEHAGGGEHPIPYAALVVGPYPKEAS